MSAAAQGAPLLRYMTKIAEGMRVVAAAAEALNSPWRVPPARPRHPLKVDDPAGVRIIWFRDFKNHPAIMAAYRDAVSRLALNPGDAIVPRVRILPPHSRMMPHKDHLTSTRRHHLILQADASGVLVIRTGVTSSERCAFLPGELWQLDLGNRTHFAINGSDRPRVIIVLDVVPATVWKKALAQGELLPEHLDAPSADEKVCAL